MTDNNQSSEINLNLKIPPERTEEGGTFGDIVLTIYKARKSFILCCAIGVALGVIATSAYYVVQMRNSTLVITPGETSISLTLNYPGAQLALFPDGEEFSEVSFYDPELWTNALSATGREDIVPADAMRVVEISHIGSRAEVYESEAEGSIQNRLLVNSTFELRIPPEAAFLESSSEREVFLGAFGDEYKKLLNKNYFHEGNAGLLYTQHFATWRDLCREIQWHPFRFDYSFIEIETRYSALADLLKTLYREDPLYKTNDGKSFNDLAEELMSICDNGVRYWIKRVSDNVYIRNTDRFEEEFSYLIDSMGLRREYSLEIISAYSGLLSSFQQKDTADGAIVSEAVELLKTAQEHADAAADLQSQIKQMELYIELLETNTAIIRTNSREAETALTQFTNEMIRNQDYLSEVIIVYYNQVNSRIAENSVMLGTPHTDRIESGPVNISTSYLIVIFVGVSVMGVAIGFCTAFIKKHIPEKVSNK